MTELSHGQRVISRALSLMQNKGYGWSKAIAMAAETFQPTPHARPAGPQQKTTPHDQ